MSASKGKLYHVGFPRARARHGATKRGQAIMNKTEQRYADRLVCLKRAGEIVEWRFEPLKLRLGEDWKTTYTPDFMVITNELIIELHDVKGGGGWEEDARVKVKTAAAMFPEFTFVGMTWHRGEWKTEIISRESPEEKRNR